MKKTVFKMCASLAMLASPAVLLAQKVPIVKSITVKGTIRFTDPRLDSNWVLLEKESLSGKPKVIDSFLLGKDNTFSFKIKQDHQSAYTIEYKYWDRATFWSDADVKITMRGYDTARVKMKIPHKNSVEGSMDNSFIQLYTQINDLHYFRTIEEYNTEYYAKKATDTTWYSYMKNHKKYKTSAEDYADRNELLLHTFHDRPVLIYDIRNMAGTEDGEKYDKAMQLLESLITKYPWLTEAQQLKQNIINNKAQAMRLKTGQPMPSVKYPDPNGTLAGLEQYKGKYLLVDFWASWCGPCRQAIPKVKELYTQYKEKGFDVVSISIDTDKAAWRKAMKDETMPWQQLLSDNKEKTMEQFQFAGIPTLYLVDTEGKIIERFSGYSEETEAKIKQTIAQGTKSMAEKQPKTIPAIRF
ncbi:peroxiredoxin [Chitinophaga niastensis]|uniref:Peroxiredoxin n=1 Tax=Chitinophaga niastensis TaxID=536980 RepID=A0A2P8HQA0_CHINA|nr:TlpA disulfide reductase family protein [Chitinophaga niastensis]PSL48389.1 peroxiredoxin [Chitinophaga niastensis]